ncbi:HlyD family efflux transporter periplasmic adaptor subunit [Clostridium tertium]|uniref:HlyD family efflux transporter periplasmic adaptor subunit n=1 Tax=Clostridium tertium TaxID=1559 RepID=UPI00232DBCD8|nr:HlyD family efflux transporter periplasmic adaptor subunit [Clostridium tertium]MDB1956928.1 HlyD family efflux transporter periplasmic adaptor subunit [Clostridium tertium]MDB1960095.1 HlyD family efflux transporter periplasmic adaptor subunit [Clostridium tertium]MDB1963896.1 HlyD family efflux transporter periplasmic adaptor subunit [Clostridium tertium]MDB1967959.1 HlyD family efflux transporter periplasmic adaptor subunit [Clostridium tertium]
MKFKIENIEELTDSRQVMESKPNKFISIFIGLVLIILIISFIWLWFGEKEEVIKVSGIINLKEQSQVVSNEIIGIVKEFNVKNGEDIKQGDIIYTLDDTSFIIQKENLESQKEKLVSTNENIDKFIKSINDGVNYFEENEEEKEFYYKYKAYETGNLVSVSDRESLINSKSEFNNKISELNNFRKSIEENIDYNNDVSVYKEQYNSYKISKNEIEDKINQLNKALSEIENKEEEKDIVEQIENEIKTNKNSLEKLKSDIILQINSSKEEINSQIKTIEDNIKKIDENNNISKEKSKTTILAQIEEQKSLNNSKIEELDISIKEVNTNIEKCSVKSEVDGKIDIKNELQTGMIIQSGVIVGEIINDESNLEVELIITDKDIGKLAVNQEIKYNISSLPYTEFGFVNGEVESLSLNSKVDEKKGVVYYTGVGNLEKNNLKSYNGESFDIKAGMTCEAQIITGKKKMLYYLLEKLNIQIK